MFYDNLMNYPSFVPGYMPNSDLRSYHNPNIPKADKEEFTSPAEGYIRGNLSNTTYDTYKGFIPRKPILNTRKEELLYNLSVYDFAVHELSLYLGANPDDQSALSLLSNYIDKARNERNEYEKSYGPLSYHHLINNTIPYEYVKGPWPWERN